MHHCLRGLEQRTGRRRAAILKWGVAILLARGAVIRLQWRVAILLERGLGILLQWAADLDYGAHEDIPKLLDAPDRLALTCQHVLRKLEAIASQESEDIRKIGPLGRDYAERWRLHVARAKFPFHCPPRKRAIRRSCGRVWRSRRDIALGNRGCLRQPGPQSIGWLWGSRHADREDASGIIDPINVRQEPAITGNHIRRKGMPLSPDEVEKRGEVRQALQKRNPSKYFRANLNPFP
jgi:hypothetical protein